MFLVEWNNVFGSVERAVALVWSGEHGRDKSTCAGTGDYVEVIC